MDLVSAHDLITKYILPDSIWPKMTISFIFSGCCDHVLIFLNRIFLQISRQSLKLRFRYRLRE